MSNFHKNQKVLNSKSINMLYTPTINKLGIYSLVFDSYGLGYYLDNLSKGNQAISHGGIAETIWSVNKASIILETLEI